MKSAIARNTNTTITLAAVFGPHASKIFSEDYEFMCFSFTVIILTDDLIWRNEQREPVILAQ
jgi:hypothetical protein